MRSNQWQAQAGSTIRLRWWRWPLWGVMLTSAMALGCASPRHQPAELGKSDGLAAAQLPAFLSGPVSMLLTNLGDYSARITLSETNSRSSPISGNLFQQEGQLLFVCTSDESLNRNPWAGSFRFLWNVSSNSGLVISQALHGYAPVHSSMRYRRPTTAQVGSIKAVPELIDGQTCQLEDVVVNSIAGDASEFRVWRASELDGLPLQIISTAQTNSIVLRLSELNPDRLSPELFSPPDGFVRYESIETMVSALSQKPRIMPYTHESSERTRSRK